MTSLASCYDTFATSAPPPTYSERLVIPRKDDESSDGEIVAQKIALFRSITGIAARADAKDSRFRAKFGEVINLPVAKPVANLQTFRLTARLRMLKRLPENHDGEGALAPLPRSVDEALAFLPQIDTTMTYSVTLNDEGLAVFEFEDDAEGRFSDITFHGNDDRTVECYCRVPGAPSALFEGPLESQDIKKFLHEAGIITA